MIRLVPRSRPSQSSIGGLAGVVVRAHLGVWRIGASGYSGLGWVVLGCGPGRLARFRHKEVAKQAMRRRQHAEEEKVWKLGAPVVCPTSHYYSTCRRGAREGLKQAVYVCIWAARPLGG